MVFETERLELRRFTVDDFEDLSAILQDERTMYAYNGAFTSTETHDWLNKQLVRYETDGFGLWAVVLKESHRMIGQCGLTFQPIEDERVLEIGYLFNRNYWGNGYAFEAAMACKLYAFNSLNFNEVYSIIRDTNLPSINVAIRIGMLARKRIVKFYRGIEMPHIIFSTRK